ncbi:S8 family peptidase [Lachnoclostridium phytofermentans]|uniref:Peptidase S8 and S53 subtilisin kexin sedolisin n=1 Tax=Lachnoclostridium phytofermentans (strain ATCC 700394 / DSM 18823 / ISDg) TaxID=357809 RepID=A9KQN5_LACP7|nr:S8 family peptidase [Lachnoclostridium phytofermentans]ABX41948.1 peptidase S8 and S53 subtilisin kexin sedolisin [Lachnoclostridium phytofermentans ISDg]
MENQFISENYFDLLIPNASVGTLNPNIVVTRVNNTYSIFHLPYADINKCDFNSFGYNNIPKCFILESTFVLEVTGVKRVQSNPNLALMGTGALIGIIDSGINYLHPAFLFNDNTSRIISIWDQTVNPNDPPVMTQDFPYGTIYTKEDINRALEQPYPLEVVPTDDPIGHGTAIAGIAGGSADSANDFSGVAPLAEFVIVKMKQAKNIAKDFLSISSDVICYQETDVMMGVKYVEKVAQQLNRPLALCIALGSNQGSRDGLGPLSSYLNDLSELPRTCVTISAGNQGNTRRHYSKVIRSVEEYIDVEFNVAVNDKKFFLEIWTEPILRISLDIISPSGERIENLTPGFSQTTFRTFVFGPTKLCVKNVLTVPITGDQLIWLRFEDTQSGLWRLRMYNIDRTNAEVDAWLPAGYTITNDTYFIESDSFTTITTPGDTVSPITISSYDTLTGGISVFSSKGYTRVNEIKPDLVAPGTELTAPTSTNGYVNVSGTGAAAAVSAGIVALIFEWAITRGFYTGITGVEIKTFLIRGADRELLLDYPNRTWGYGKVNLYGVFEKLIL